MSGYVLPHELAGEQYRLELMSALLDPLERSHIKRLGICPGWRCLELGCGNGSIAKTLAEYVAPTGHVVASDLDIRYIQGLQVPCLEVRRIDLLEGQIEEEYYDFVVARALLHHLTPARIGLERMVKALKPGGFLLSIEPDMLPCMVTEPDTIHDFWRGWLTWSVEAGIDYFVGRKIPKWLDSMGLKNVAGEGYTAHFNGGSLWAQYWLQTMNELAPVLLSSGYITKGVLEECKSWYRDPHYWTSMMTYTASWGEKPSAVV